MKQILLIFATVCLSASVWAGPKPAGDFKKSFYTTPINEFRGAVFYQWKKYEVKFVVAKSETTKEEPQDKMPKETKAASASAKKD